MRMTLETSACLGKPLMQLLGDSGARVAECSWGLFTKQQCVQGALQKLSTRLCRDNALLELGVACFFV